MTAVDPGLAEAVLEEAARHKQRSPGRRAAGQVWVALMTTTSTEAARKAIGTFGRPEIQADALALLDRLTGAPSPQQEDQPAWPR